MPDRSNAPVVGRPHWTGGTGAALRGHDRNDGLPPYRPPWKTNDGDLDCGTSCPLSGLNERTAHPGGASEGAGLSPDVSSPLIGRPMGRTRVPPGFHPRRFPCPAVAGVGRRARRAWKLKVALPGGLGPPACGLGNRRSVLVSYGSNAPEDAGARLNATRFSCGTIRDMSDGFVRRQRRPATATCGPCHLSPPGRRTVRGEFRPPLVVFPYPLPLCCLSGSHSNDRSALVRFNLH